jgi:hypothetical protein
VTAVVLAIAVAVSLMVLVMFVTIPVGPGVLLGVRARGFTDPPEVVLGKVVQMPVTVLGVEDEVRSRQGSIDETTGVVMEALHELPGAGIAA